MFDECTPCPADSDYQSWLKFLNIKPSWPLLQRIADFLSSYLRRQGLRHYVLGVSGGIDSAFAAALLHYFNIPHRLFSIPIQSNTLEEQSRAKAVCRAYKDPDDTCAHHDLTALYHVFSSRLSTVFKQTTPTAEGNIKARMRMIFLYHAAQLSKGCVLSTDQLDELLTGFWTLHGDVGDVSPLQLLPKSVEYELARLLGKKLRDSGPLEAAAAAVPTDGLGISSSDLSQMGALSFVSLEAMFKRFFELKIKQKASQLTGEEHAELSDLLSQKPITLFLATNFKRRGPALFNPLNPT